MSSSKGLRRALSPKRSLRLEAQGSEGSGLNRLSFTGSRKRTRKQSKLQASGAAIEVDHEAFFDEWKITLQEEVRIASFNCYKCLNGLLTLQSPSSEVTKTVCISLQEKRLAELHASLDKEGVLRPQFGELNMRERCTWRPRLCPHHDSRNCLQIFTCSEDFCVLEIMMSQKPRLCSWHTFNGGRSLVLMHLMNLSFKREML